MMVETKPKVIGGRRKWVIICFLVLLALFVFLLNKPPKEEQDEQRRIDALAQRTGSLDIDPEDPEKVFEQNLTVCSTTGKIFDFEQRQPFVFSGGMVTIQKFDGLRAVEPMSVFVRCDCVSAFDGFACGETTKWRRMAEGSRAFFLMSGFSIRSPFRGALGGVHIGDRPDAAIQLASQRFGAHLNFRRRPEGDGVEWGTLYNRFGPQPQFSLQWTTDKSGLIDSVYVDNRRVVYLPK